MSETSVVVHADAAALAPAVAARLIATIVDAQAGGNTAHVVLTGGRVAAAVLRAIGESSDAVDWSRVDLWWGDERFLPSGHADRNETQARSALLDTLPLDPARIHAMPASDGPDGDDPDAAAARYAEELASAAEPGTALPRFDVLMLGVGEDGHVASIFPGHPDADQAGSVAAVRDSPKPPPTRITLTMPTIRTAAQVWLIAAGPDKTDAVGRALGGDRDLPAARVSADTRTLWLLDEAAAANVPGSARTTL